MFKRITKTQYYFIKLILMIIFVAVIIYSHKHSLAMIPLVLYMLVFLSETYVYEKDKFLSRLKMSFVAFLILFIAFIIYLIY